MRELHLSEAEAEAVSVASVSTRRAAEAHAVASRGECWTRLGCILIGMQQHARAPITSHSHYSYAYAQIQRSYSARMASSGRAQRQQRVSFESPLSDLTGSYSQVPLSSEPEPVAVAAAEGQYECEWTRAVSCRVVSCCVQMHDRYTEEKRRDEMVRSNAKTSVLHSEMHYSQSCKVLVAHV